jgi:bifunctional DNA-binding transcriptional regulator/antitoxin component of YhaV-PrlF toxin-antitoxin module
MNYTGGGHYEDKPNPGANRARGQRRQVVIPREILETLKLEAGDFVAFAKQKNGVLIKPKRMVDPDDTLSPAEAKSVRRGEAQLRRGESKPWRVVKHALSR